MSRYLVKPETILEELRETLGVDVLMGLKDPKVTEIMYNGDGRLWVEHRERGMSEVKLRGELGEEDVEAALRVIAGTLDQEFNRDHPVLECAVPIEGSRLEAVLPPVSVRGPIFCLRKHAPKLFALESFLQPPEGRPRGVEAERVDPSLSIREALQWAVETRARVLVAGATGSGKTSLLNSLVGMAHGRWPDERWVILENVQELQVSAANSVRLEETPLLDIDLRALVKITMRLRPTYICIGEVRGGEALELLKAWLTGHPGFSTVHADSARDGLTRLEQLNEEGGTGAQRSLIARSVDLVVHTREWRGVRFITEAFFVGSELDPDTRDYQLFPVEGGYL